MNQFSNLLFLIFTLSLVLNCARAPIKSRQLALRPAAPVEIQDMLDIESLRQSLKQNISFLLDKGPIHIQMGPHTVSKEILIRAQLNLLAEIENFNPLTLNQAIQKHFDFFEVYGRSKWGEVLVTSYFDPIIKGSSTPTKIFSQALYRTPDDMAIIDIDKYAERFPELQSLFRTEQKTIGHTLRGRIVREAGSVSRIEPYYDRAEIDQQKLLEGKKLEIVWVDPVDAFFLHIQGSGIVELSNKKLLRVGYAAQNGHKYEALGKYLLDHIPLEKMSLQKIEKHLRSLPQREQADLLSKNPSYVFFRELNSSSITSLGTPVVPGRTIAIDQSLFPKGALAYLEVQKPVFEGDSDEPIRFEPAPRLVIDQDTGGAIRGSGRVDLYWGLGDQAKRHAGVMKELGRLYYLVPKGL